MDVALVDLDYAELDAFRAQLAERLGGGEEGRAEAARARVRLVLCETAQSPAFAWAGLGGVPRAGETGRLGEVVVDAVIVSAHSARQDVVARLAASLGAHVLVLPAAEPQAGAPDAARAQDARP
jgi:hypothetical protein